MSLPDTPFLVQILWEDSDPATPWDTPLVNYLSDQVQHIEIDRWSFRGSLRAHTCAITVTDEGLDVRPGKDSSALSPNVVLGRRMRVLAQSSADEWEPWFFGYIRDYTPVTVDDNPPHSTILADGPLATLGSLSITLPPWTNLVVYDASDPANSALVVLMTAANLWETAFLDVDDVGAVPIAAQYLTFAENDPGHTTGIWGNGTKTLSEWLAELCLSSGCIVSDEPRLAASGGDVDWVLRWYQPLTDAAADFTLSAPSRPLELTPQLVFNGDFP